MTESSQKIRDLLEQAEKISLKEYDKAMSLIDKAERLSENLRDYTFKLDCLSTRALILSRRSNTDYFFDTNNLLMNLSISHNSLKYRGKAWANEGLFYWNHSKYQKALDCFEEAGKLLDKCPDPKEKALNYRNIGITRHKLSDNEQAVKFLRRAVYWSLEAADKKTAASVKYWYGYVLHNSCKYELALKHFLAALELYHEINDIYGQGLTYNSIGLIYRDIAARRKKDYFLNSLDYFQKALKCGQQLNNHRLIADVYNNIGLVCLRQRKYEETLKNYFRSLEIRKKEPFKENEAITLNNIGGVYQIMGDFDKAYHYYNQALEIRRKLGQTFYLVTSLTSLLDFLSTTNMLEEAGLIYNEIKKIEPKIKDRFTIVMINASLSKYFEAKGDYQQALKYFKKEKSLEEDLFNERIDKQLKELEHQYQLKLSRLRQEKKIAREKEYAAKAMAVTVTHELNQPLTVLQGYVQLIIDHNDNFREDEKNKRYIENINIALTKINRLLRTLNNQKNIRYECYSTDTDMVSLDK